VIVSHWRLGESDRIASEKGGPDAQKPGEFAESGFDSVTGVATSMVRFDAEPRIFGRIDRHEGGERREDRYAYWLDGKPSRKNEAGFLIRCLLDQFGHWTLDS
jgi:hypothetical protein